MLSATLSYVGTNALSTIGSLAKLAFRVMRTVGFANSTFALSVTAAYLLVQAGLPGLATRACLVAGIVVTYWVLKHLMVRTLGPTPKSTKCSKRNHRRRR